MKAMNLFLRLAFPPRCAGCGERFDIFENDTIGAFCPTCRAAWEREKMSVCKGCGHESVSCDCVGRFLKDTRVLSLVKFGQKGCVDRLIYSLKRKRNDRFFDFASEELYKRLKSEEALMGADFSDAVITNVPRRIKTRREFGFDHAATLAEAVSELMGVDYSGLLKRRLGGKPQKKTGGARRFKNVKGRFAAISDASIEGKTVILIDDVMTTGATASECVRELKRVGAAEVILLTIARAESEKKQRRKKVTKGEKNGAV